MGNNDKISDDLGIGHAIATKLVENIKTLAAKDQLDGLKIEIRGIPMKKMMHYGVIFDKAMFWLDYDISFKVEKQEDDDR